MAAQGERMPGVIDMCSLVGEPMVQDEIPVQDIPVQEQLPPQINSEPEMGAAAAVAYDTSPSLLRNPPPIPAETAHPRAPGVAQLFALLAEIQANAQQMSDTMDSMNSKMDANMQAFRNDMRALWGETQGVGQCLQAGKMATPRAGSSELRGSAPAGEDRVIRETCWARVVTEEVTVTQWEELNGVTECTETRETEGELDGVKEAAHTHTHRGSEGQWGRARTACGDPVRAAGCPPSGTEGDAVLP